MKLRHGVLILCAAIAAAAIGASPDRWLLASLSARAASRPPAERPAQSVSPHDVALCRALISEDGLSVTRHEEARRSRHAPAGRVNVLRAATASGTDSVAIYRDAATADLRWLVVSRVVSRASRLPRPLTQREAVATARGFLADLEIPRRGTPWVLERAPLFQPPAVWCVKWASGDRRAILRIDARTGDLRVAALRRTGDTVRSR